MFNQWQTSEFMWLVVVLTSQPVWWDDLCFLTIHFFLRFVLFFGITYKLGYITLFGVSFFSNWGNGGWMIDRDEGHYWAVWTVVSVAVYFHWSWWSSIAAVSSACSAATGRVRQQESPWEQHRCGAALAVLSALWSLLVADGPQY